MPLPKNSILFKPIKVGNVTLENRLVYAPTTRLRNTSDFIATDSLLDYYRERAENNGGLLIVEDTAPISSFGFFKHGPVIETPEQVEAWKNIVSAVHANGSFASLQMWHVGRAADAKIIKEYGLPYVGPTAIHIDEASEKTAQDCGVKLKELTKPEIKEIIKQFAAGAVRAVNVANFDFVEIHGAHMFLLDQFLQEKSNQRADEYGGSIENRARFMLEVVDALIDAIGAQKVGLRLSPYVQFFGAEGINAKINPIVTWDYVLSELERRAKNGEKIAYVSVVEPIFSSLDSSENVDLSWVDKIWKGPIIKSGAFLDGDSTEYLDETVGRDNRTLIGVSRYFTSNPDLLDRLKNGYELTPYDRPNFYNAF